MDRTQTMIVVIAASFLAVVLLVISSHGTDSNLPRPAPDFDLEAADGSRFELSAHRGELIFVNFWATWCPPCVAETPALEELHDRFDGRGLRVIGVSVDDDWETVNRFTRRHGVGFTILLDPRARTPHRYGTFKYPESYLIDAEGRIVRKWIGGIDRNWAEVLRDVEGFVAQTPKRAPSEARATVDGRTLPDRD